MIKSAIRRDGPTAADRYQRIRAEANLGRARCETSSRLALARELAESRELRLEAEVELARQRGDTIPPLVLLQVKLNRVMR